LPEFAAAGNVLALAIYDDVLHVINMSRHRHLIFHSPTDAMRRLMSSQQQSIGFQHLLSSLRSIAAEGWFRSLRHGDTGVGYTIETKLGISANSSKAPDYMGVEIKSTRSRPGKDKVTLFSRTPHWRLSSALGGLNAREFIKRVGVLEGKFRRYYATVYPRPNPQGVYSRIVRSNDQVRFETRIGEPDELAHCWQLLELEDALRVKHKQTAFLEVETRSGSAGEEFRLSSVTYRSGPIIENLEYLLESGDITLDYTLRELSDTRVRDHGYLFRMSGGRLRKLFAKELEFPLGD
jgi:hypothetical protein